MFGFKIGDVLYTDGWQQELWETTVKVYNEIYRKEGDSLQNATVFEAPSTYSNTSCTIKGFVESESPNGKFPTAGFFHNVIRSDY